MYEEGPLLALAQWHLEQNGTYPLTMDAVAVLGFFNI